MLGFIEILKTLLLGVVEGITEWLPISSTGHMILVDEFVRMDISPAFRELFLYVIQLGAILAVVCLFWKKMWPFNMIWPQVDFNRIVRFMGEIATSCRSQKSLVAQAQKKSQDFEKKFLNAVPAYLDALETSCDKLAAAAQWKQEWLERKAKGGAKLRKDVSEYNNLLKDYEKAQGDLVRAGAFVQMGWGEVVLALRETSK